MRAELELTEDEWRELEDVVTRSERAVRDAFGGVAPGDRMAAASLLVQDEDDVVPTHLAVATEADWARVAAIGDPGRRWEAAWNPTGWSYDVLDVAADDRRADVDQRLVEAVRGHGVDDASRWILQEVCRRVAHAPPAGALPHFACVVVDPGLGADVEADLVYALPPEAAARLDALGLLHP
ncbi:MAG TPA: hypothetical protein VI318_19475 [Baekduia sp.]